MVRSRFKCLEKAELEYGGTRFQFHAVWDDGIPENQRYAKATPSGTLTIVVNNPGAIEQFRLGKHYYLDLTPCEEQPRTPAEAVDPAA